MTIQINKMEIISKWSVLSQLSQEFVNCIQFICVFGDTEDDVIFVTKYDNVFAFGSNKNGLLGLGHKNAIKYPTKVNELCNKQIFYITFGRVHVMALTKTGLCYSWGGNDYGQLGNGTQTDDYLPKVITALSDKTIIDISCGFKYTIVLTNLGEVYGFGYNTKGELGVGNNTNQSLPIKLNGFNEEKLICISSGYHHVLALTKSDKVYGWGYNKYGQLGINNTIHHNTPQLINMNGVIIQKIICGFYHSLLLSNEGEIFTFGYSQFGQIGNGNTVNQNIPFKIINTNKFVKIASENMSNISIAKSSDGKYVVWGECHDRNVLLPEEIAIESIHDCLAFYSKRKVTFRPMTINQTVYEDFQLINNCQWIFQLFNNPKDSDFKFKLEDQYIFVHKLILKTRCDHFRIMFSENWDKNETKEIEIDLYSYPVYYSFLKYIYTKCVEIEVEFAIELYDLANCYCEEELKKKCIQMLKRQISIENSFILYSSAVKYSFQELEEICLRFAAKNMNKVCLTQDFENLDLILCKRFIKSAAILEAFN